MAATAAERVFDRMSDTEPRNNLSWRVTVLERQVQTLQDGKPDVVAERVGTLSGRMNDMRSEFKEEIHDLRKSMIEGDNKHADAIKNMNRIMVGFFTALGVAIAAAVISVILTGGP